MEVALQGVRVLDLTRALAGPYGSLFLGDLGAEVIKIEAPSPRPSRGGPFSYKGMDAYFMGVNRSKKSVALDLTKPQGRQVFYDLVKVSDVVYDNYRPTVPKRLGIDYDTLKKINPRIICCSITGFGSTGPLRDRPAFDLPIQALSGAVAATGHREGPPVRNSIAVADQGAGLMAVIGILAALVARERTGVGQKVETSLLEATIAQLGYEAALYFVSGIVQERIGSGHLIAIPYGIYKTADDYIAIAAQRRFEALCQVMGRPELAQDPRFQGENLLQNRQELEAILEEVFPTRSTEEWLRLLEEADIPCAPVNRLDQALSHPQVLERQMVISLEHVLGGEVKLVGNPIKMSATPPEERQHFISPPLLGQHTEEVLGGILGYPSTYIEELRQQGVIQ